MASDFPAYVARGYDATVVEEFTPSQVSGETFIPGDFVVWDGTNDWVERGGTNPTGIYGISEVDSEAARVLTENGKVPIRQLWPGCILALSSATTYDEATHRGTEYGITRNASGHWQLDVSKTTTNARVVVVDGDPDKNIWFCRPLAEYFDNGIDS